MALVDTGPLTIAVDRSLFGPQGRRWIERKLPEVASNLMFIVVSAFGACILMYYICVDYQRQGLLHGLACFPKHIANGIVLHFVARLLRWHVGRAVHNAFVPDDTPDVFSRWALDAIATHDNKTKNKKESVEFENTAQLPWFQNSLQQESPPNKQGNVEERNGSLSKYNSDDNATARSPLSSRCFDEESVTPVHSNAFKSLHATDLAREISAMNDSDSAAHADVDSTKPRRSSDTFNDRKKLEPALESPPQGNLDLLSKGGSSFSYSLRGRRRRSSKANSPKIRYFTEETAHELLKNLFFIKIVDVDGWMFVEDELHDPKEMAGLGWVLNLFHRGYRVSVRYVGDVGPSNAHRMLFQAEPGRTVGHIRIRSRGSNTFLFMLGMKRPLTLVAWDHDVFGGGWEDMKIMWLPKPYEGGEVLIWSRVGAGFLQWTGQKFIHVTSTDSASRFMLQSLK